MVYRRYKGWVRAVCPQEGVVGEWTPRGHPMAKMRLQMRSTGGAGRAVPSPGWGASAACATSNLLLPTPAVTPSGKRTALPAHRCHRLPPGSLICLRQPPAWCPPSTSLHSSFCSEAGGGSCLSQTQPWGQAGAHLQSRDSRTHRPRGCLGDTPFLPCFYSNLDAWAGTWWVSST